MNSEGKKLWGVNMRMEPMVALRMPAKRILMFDASSAPSASFIPRNNPTRAEDAAAKPTGNMKKKVLMV